MTTVICDSCKKSIPGPHREVNYVTLLNKDLCVPCSKKLELSARELMEKERAYHLEAFKKHQREALTKLTK